MRLTRRQFLAGALGATAMGAGGAVYARYIEPRLIRRRVVKVRLNGKETRDPLRVLHLSDFHLSRVVPLSLIAEGIRKGLSLRPDLICVTGDFITKQLFDEDAYRVELARLSDHAPTFACLGNHDGGLWAGVRGGYRDGLAVRRLLEDSGIRVLHNDSVAMDVRGLSVRITGLGDDWAGDMDVSRAFSFGASRGERHVVLSHNPDTKRFLKDRAWHLLLCGHTHGGQVRIPFVGAPVLPVHDTTMYEGLHEWEGRVIHITRGIGNLHGIRFNCPPEVNLLVVV